MANREAPPRHIDVSVTFNFPSGPKKFKHITFHVFLNLPPEVQMMMIWNEALLLEEGNNRCYSFAGITYQRRFFIKQRSPITKGRNRSFQRLIASASGDTVDLGGPKSKVMKTCRLARLLGLERTRHKVEGYELHEPEAVRLENGATKSCVLDILAELVNEVKRRMEYEGGEMDDLVTAMGKLWLDRSSPADHKRVFDRMIFAALI